MPSIRNFQLRWITAMAAALIAGAVAIFASTSAAPAKKIGPTRSRAPAPVPGETYVWRAVAIGGGGLVTGQSFDASGRTHVIRTDVFGAYLWNPAIDRWVQLVSAATMPMPDRDDGTIASGGAYEVTVAPSRPDRIFLALRRAVYRSDDGGRHFRRAWPARTGLDLNSNGPFRTSGSFMAVSPRDPDLVLLATPTDGLWRSANAGATWSQVPDSIGGEKDGPALIWFHPGTGRAWVLMQGRGMMEARDDAATRFTPFLDAGEGPRTLSRGLFDGKGRFFGVDRAKPAIWRRDNASWTRTAIGNVKGFAAIATDQTDGALFAFATWGGRSYRSTDGGSSWWPMMRRITDATDNEPAWLTVAARKDFIVADVTADPAVPGRMWAMAGIGPFRSDPPQGRFAIDWSSQARGVEELVATGSAHPARGIPLFTAWDFGIHARDALDRYPTTWGPRPRMLIGAQDVAWSAGHPNALVTNASDTRQCCSEDGGSVLAGYSRDGGRTWNRFPTLPHPPGTKPDDPWAMAFGTIAISSGDPDNVVWLPSANRSPFFTMDNGKTWRRVSLSGEKLPLTGSYGQYSLIRRTLAADPAAPGRFLMLHSGDPPNGALAGLWRTDDGGVHWSRIHAGHIAPSDNGSAKLRAMPAKPDNWFFTNNAPYSKDDRLRRSRDGGKTWQPAKEVNAVVDVAFGKAAQGATAPTIYILGAVNGRNGIWRSVDDGAHWSLLVDRPLGRLDRAGTLSADPDHFGRVYVSYQGSGWIYGEPAPCTPRPLDRDTIAHCAAIN